MNALASTDFSGWIEPPADRLPQLEGDQRCDVAIVGGGYTGMAAALRLVEHGAHVALLEASFCGWGASSRNQGMLTPTIGGSPQVLATVYRRRAGELMRFADTAVHETERTIERLGIDCDYEPVGNLCVALSPGQLRMSERIARFLQRAGGEVEFVTRDEFGLPELFLGGIFEKAGGMMNPGKFARGLRDALKATSARVYEESPVEAIEPRADGVTLRTPRGVIRADRVLLATNAWTRELDAAPPRIVAPVWVTAVETEPLSDEQIEGLGWTSRAGMYTQHVILEGYRLTARKTINFTTRLVQAPRGGVTTRKPEQRVIDDLTRGFHDRFPTLRDVRPERAWGGWIAMTPSWLPVAGEASERVLYACGYNGHGLAQAPYIGSLIADRLAGHESSDDLNVVWRDRPRFMPAPLFTAPALKAGWAIDRATDRFIARRT